METPFLVSACLLGLPCRYDGGSCPVPALQRLAALGQAIPICPEVVGGLPTPRPPAEIQGGDGGDVLDGRARVVREDGTDVSGEFIAGAQAALNLARRCGITQAVLKANSPSCGVGLIYDGTFSGQLTAGDGVTAALFKREGIAVGTELSPTRGGELRRLRRPSGRCKRPTVTTRQMSRCLPTRWRKSRPRNCVP